MQGDETQPLLKRLAWAQQIVDSDKDHLVSVVSDVRSFEPGDEIVPADKPVNFSSLIVDGLACREKTLDDGERQITAFHLSGDFCDLHTYMLKTIPDSVRAITQCRVANVQHKWLDEITSKSSRITHLLWKSTLIDASIYRRWLVCIGRQTARSRLAHLFCEFYFRLRVIGATDGFTCPLPPTQTDLGDAMGLSLVHVNKTCAQLRREGLVSLVQRELRIHNWNALRKLAQFDPSYLHLESDVAM